MESPPLLPRAEVERRTSLSRSQLYFLMSEGRFPRPVNLTERRVAWVAEEVDAWVKARIAERDGAAGDRATGADVDGEDSDR